MNNIIVIETGSNAQLLQDIMDFVTNRGDYHCTKLPPVIKCEKNLSFPGLYIDLEQYIVTKNGKPITMSCYEIKILVCLAKQVGKIFTKEQLYNEIYGDEKIVDVNNAIYCIIHDIRKKLKNTWKCHEYIQTVRGIGYKFVVPEE